MRLHFDESNPWHIDQVLDAMPDDYRRLALPFLFVPLGARLGVYGLTGSLQALLSGVVLLVAAVAGAPPGLWRRPLAPLAKFITYSFALSTLLLVPLSFLVLLGFNKWGIVASASTTSTFQAIGASLSVASWCVWAVGYFVRRGERAV